MPDQVAAVARDPGDHGRPPAVPDHELLRCIGRGSYGEVWLARSVLGILRAVKVIYRDRFRDARPYEREFNGILRIEPLSRANDGLVDILHVGRHEPAGYFYYVMELADDSADHQDPDSDPTRHWARYQPRTLARELKERGRLTFDECVQLGLTLSSALSHLHLHGLSHRDVKPSNILYIGRVPKLGDIGLVGDTSEAASYVGTEGYIPPEGPGTPQADVFSLGKVLYEAGTGQDRLDFPRLPPLPGEEPARARLAELNEVCLRACTPDRSRRYQTAEELHADLALLHRGQSVRRQRRNERRWKLAGFALNAALLLLGFTLGVWWSPFPHPTGDTVVSGRDPHDPALRPKPIDLARFYNASLSTNWMGDFEGNDLASLPQGRHLFAGTPFEIRGLIQLRGAYGGGFPPRVTGIPIERRCRRLQFLHSTHWYAEHGQQIGAYLVHYANGSEREIPLLFGEDIGSWWRDPQVPRPADRTVIAWTGTNLPASRSRHHDMLALYKTTWENPAPSLRIKSIDFVSTLTACSPFLIAITAE